MSKSVHRSGTARLRPTVLEGAMMGKDRHTAVDTIDAYLAATPEPERAALEALRSVTRKAAPDATERIGYKIPVFALKGDLVGFAAQPRHLSLYTMSPARVAAMREQLAPFKVSGATIHFSPEAPLSDDLVEAIVTARIEENEARRAGK